jgi:hypothetical protein
MKARWPIFAVVVALVLVAAVFALLPHTPGGPVLSRLPPPPVLLYLERVGGNATATSAGVANFSVTSAVEGLTASNLSFRTPSNESFSVTLLSPTGQVLAVYGAAGWTSGATASVVAGDVLSFILPTPTATVTIVCGPVGVDPAETATWAL